MNETPGRILGIGGIFFKSRSADTLRAWYREKLGIDYGPAGAMFQWTANDREQLTILSIFPESSKQFEKGMMINYIVDDLDAFLAKAEATGARIDPKREDSEYGRFAWIYDPEENKIELWQPAP